MFNLLRRHERSTPENISVVIYSPIRDRILRAIETSSIEEGGKLFGYVDRSHERIRIHAVTYVDSGPQVSNSATHIIPDGEYQESVYRLLERLDPDLEHIGSWHSHHCNGYPHLSSGDIQGYHKSVRDPRYNLDVFYAMLVLGRGGMGLKCRHFLFTRDENHYNELSPQAIEIVEAEYQFEGVLSHLEQVVRDFRRHPNRIPARIENTLEPVGSDALMQVRVADKVWLEERFAYPLLTRNKSTGELSWRWEVAVHQTRLQVKLTYPAAVTEPSLLQVSLESALLMHVQVPLDHRRYEVIAKVLSEISLAPTVTGAVGTMNPHSE